MLGTKHSFIVVRETSYFWYWIDSFCPVGMTSKNCVYCGDYSVITCVADMEECYKNGSEYGPACPYEQCRTEILRGLLNANM
jgi:hypothetical protein